MWWSKPSFKKKFVQIKGGWSPLQVWELLGVPKETEETEIPLGSDWVNQPGMTFRMKAGDPVQQWMFEDNGEFYYLWFAKVSYADEDPWRVTLTKKMPRRISA
ncbi:MAG: hypothetical protein ABSH11_09735 [Verrucomicrobiota bacterium]